VGEEQKKNMYGQGNEYIKKQNCRESRKRGGKKGTPLGLREGKRSRVYSCTGGKHSRIKRVRNEPIVRAIALSGGEKRLK